LGAALAALCFAATCFDPTDPSGPPEQPLFLVHTSRPGLEYANLSGDDEQWSIVEQNGQGLAMLDFDGDGRMDLFVTNGGTLPGWRAGDLPGPSLYRNLGDWRFEDVTARAGLADRDAWGTGCAAADFDDDGDTDLYVTGWGANRLYRNEGDGRFTDVTDRAGVGEDRWSSSAVFADFDGDGRLDLYVSNYVVFDPDRVPEAEEDGSPCRYRSVRSGCGPWRYSGERDTLYLQTEGGRFVDASDAWGLAATDGFRGMGIAPGDFDRDGDVDVYVGCDVMPNLYLENISRSGFRSAGRARGGSVNADGQHESGMGVAAVDLFGRGELDVLATNFAGEKNTYYSGAEGLLEDRSSSVGFDGHRAELGWGLVVADFDGDGARDVFVANGHIYPQVEELRDPEDRYRQLPRIYLGTGGQQLRELPPESALRRAGRTRPCPSGSCLAFSLRAAAAGDLDNDGDLDVVAVQHNGPLVVFENRSDRSVPIVTLETRRGGASPHGARIAIGDWSHDHWPTSGYQSSHDPRVHLPRAEADVARVTWPDGGCEVFAVQPAAEIAVWRQGGGDRSCEVRVTEGFDAPRRAEARVSAPE
jgi:hypothetical protein